MDLIDNVAMLLFEKFGDVACCWEELQPEERQIFSRAAQDVLTRFAAAAPFDAEQLVEKVRETRPTRLGFLHMAYSLNRTEAAALLAFRAGLPRERGAAV